MEEIVVEILCGGAALEFNIREDEKIQIQNLTGSKFFKWKCHKTKKFQFKLWHFVIVSFIFDRL